MTTVDQLVELASKRARLHDFGSDSWREGLEILVRELNKGPNVSDSGRAKVESQFVDALWNRLRVIDYSKQHPEIADEKVERPLVILGMPRTGTTVASYLLHQDPRRRSLLNWEALDSIPPPTTDSLGTDPRCLAKLEGQRKLANALVASGKGYAHWEDADGPTECIFVQCQEFKAFVWDAFQPSPAYSDWLLGCDVSSAYDYEKLVLQILQSRAPGTWSLKMPSHAVFIDALTAAFPDVRIVWAHRDPYKATASLCSLQAMPQTILTSGRPDRPAIGRRSVTQMRAHLDRPLRAREKLGSDRFYDLHYAELMRDPIGEMRRLYDWAGDDLTPSIEASMQHWLDQNPQDRFGPRPYSLAEYGLSKEALTPVFEEYLSVFDIELEDS